MARSSTDVGRSVVNNLQKEDEQPDLSDVEAHTAGENQQHNEHKHQPDHSSTDPANITKVHEFYMQSDTDGIKLVPALPEAAPTPMMDTMYASTVMPIATFVPRNPNKTTPATQQEKYSVTPTPTALSEPRQPSFNTFVVWFSAMGVKPISTEQTLVSSLSSAGKATVTMTGGNEQHTVLTTSLEVAMQPIAFVEVSARLLTDDALPVPNQAVALLMDESVVQHSVTDAQGVIRFQLPSDLTIGDHTLSYIFAGNDWLLPAVVDSVLHYHGELIGTSARNRSSRDVASSASSLPSGFAENAKPTSVALNLPASTLSNDASFGIATLGRRTKTLVASLLAQLSILSAIIPFASSHRAGEAGLLLLALGSIGVMAAPVLRRRHKRLLPMFKFSLAKSLQLPIYFWYGLRIVSIGCALGLAAVLFVRPERGLFIFWRLFIPFVPLLFFIAPAVWRNICPMAALNQVPRLFDFSKAWTTPKWMQRYGYLISISLFLLLASSRKVIFNQNGAALAILILCSLLAAFVMGNFFKGKSGWCSSICPLLPVQRIYGQTPFVTVNHAHCQPCLGCTKNCYDLSPQNAYLADLYDEDRQFAGFRKAFVGLFPGFVLAFYLLPNPPVIAIWQLYSAFALICALSMASFFAVEKVTRVSSNKITVLYGALALNAYYWFNSVGLGSLIATPAPDLIVWPLRTLVFGLTLLWIYRTWQKEQPFIELTLAPQTFHSEFRTQPQETRAGESNSTPVGRSTTNSGKPVVRIEPEGKQIVVENNRTLLEIFESNNLPIESGCRMGLCGADPICIHEGMEQLSKVGSDERNTLDRLALPRNTRLACMARVRGNVTIGLAPAKPDIYQSSIVAGFKYEKSIKRVVIVGNGIAGVTAADHVRRRHPHCEIHLIGRERHHLYNRMGIARLIYGRSAMQGLYLLPDQWYDDFNITCWLNTHVTAICRAEQKVQLGTGEEIVYDRLILTTGSQSFVPSITGFGVAGSFVLRSADDAMAIRSYVQEQNARKAVVAGGGLLGLEAAYALYKLGLEVTVLERSSALLTRQLDSRSAEFLRAYLQGLGIQVLMEAEVALLLDTPDCKGRAYAAQLKNGRRLPCDLLLVAAGIAPDIELAKQSGLKVNRAVVVDSQMRTNDPYIFAAGDVAEYDEKVYGLWPVAVSQAEVAAVSAVAGPGVSLAEYIESAPVTMLKVAGIDVTSMGRIRTEDAGEEEIVLEDRAAHRYRKLVIADGKIIGAILLDAQDDAPGVTEAIKQQLDVTAHLSNLRVGDWSVLHELA